MGEKQEKAITVCEWIMSVCVGVCMVTAVDELFPMHALVVVNILTKDQSVPLKKVEKEVTACLKPLW
jgi:hypothetical protein